MRRNDAGSFDRSRYDGIPKAVNKEHDAFCGLVRTVGAYGNRDAQGCDARLELKAEKKAEEGRKGTVTGVVTAKGEAWIEVKADGAKADFTLEAK